MILTKEIPKPETAKPSPLKRNETLDIIRIISLFCINGVHFFRNSGFYSVPVEGAQMMIMCVFRSLFIICVPMFLMLSGYLMNKKELSKKYFWGITKTLGTYFICSVAFAFFMKAVFGKSVTVKSFITDLFSFGGTSYAWYIEMYLGLYLLIPFLNMIFNNLKDKKQAKCLIAVLFIVCILPSFINQFRFDSAQWWLSPAESKEYFKILPQWWDRLFPIFFYFLGAYLSRYKPDIPVSANIMLLIAAVVLDGAFSFYRSFEHTYVWGDWNSNSSPTTALTAFLVFTLLLNIRFKKENKSRTQILKMLSDSCVFAYLISGMYDTFFYGILAEEIPTAQDRFKFAPLMIAVVFISSLSSGVVLSTFYRWIHMGLKKAAEIISGKKRRGC